MSIDKCARVVFPVVLRPKFCTRIASERRSSTRSTHSIPRFYFCIALLPMKARGTIPTINGTLLHGGSKGKGRCPFPLHSYPRQQRASAALRKTPRHESFLTNPITWLTIIAPASLRSDRLIGLGKISDRFHTRILIAFAGIRRYPTQMESMLSS